MSLVKQLILDGYAKQPRKRWPTHDGQYLDRTQYVTSSEVAYCERKIYYGKKSPIKGDELNGYAERGHTAEAWIVEQLQRLEGYVLQYAGDDQVSFYHGMQSGTPDGLLYTPEGDVYLLEFKCIDPRTNKRALPKKAHVWQVQQNMHLVRKCINVIVEKAIVVYIDASDYGSILEYEIDFDPDLVAEIAFKARRIMTYKGVDDTSPEGVYNGDCKFCDYKAVCSGAVEQKKRETMKVGELKNVASKYFG